MGSALASNRAARLDDLFLTRFVAANICRMLWADMLEIVSGGLLLALALANESQERRVQSWFETAWLQLAYVQDAAVGRHMRFMHQVASACNSALNHLFGKRLISIRGILVSATLGLALFLVSFWLLYALLGEEIINKAVAERNLGNLSVGQVRGVMSILQSVLGLAGFYLVVFALLPALLKPKAVPIWMMLAGLLWVCLLGPCTSVPSANTAIDPFVMAICIGVLSDLFLVSILRVVFRKAGTTKSALVGVLLTCISVLFGLIMVSLPIVFSLAFPKSWDVQVSFLLAILNNSAVALVALLPLLVVVAYACHKLLWHPFNNALYAIQRYRTVADQKPALVYSGMILTATGLGATPGWLLGVGMFQGFFVFALGLGVIVFLTSILRTFRDENLIRKIRSDSDVEVDLNALVMSTIGRFAINTANLTSEEKKRLAIEQLVERRRRLRLGVVLSSVVIVSTSAVVVIIAR
jgi:hypothetical protein